ncbi:hypothetical protein NYW84_06370 [Acinetobacter junii]|uniref:hypothetical protein n=1 Tax=Acinetobacter junii TaxID=40215 RepID=UPI002DB74969|nr:hypothetical protein [Acinetobacter junii]MEB8380686.1 hypothetical protein [Acinetobacter junii]
MVGPKPYGLHVKNGELTQRDMQFISSIVHRFLSYKHGAELENLKLVYDLPDGGYFIVQEQADIFRVIADKDILTPNNFVNDGTVKMYIPLFYSGIITKARVAYGDKVRLKLTQNCIQRLFKATDQTPSQEIALERFTIEASPRFPEFLPQQSSNFITTQYVGQNAGWYSGSMAKLMQLVGGYGRQDFEELPNNPFERAQIKLPEKLSKQLWADYQDIRLPCYSGVPPKDGTFQYDYKANKTHGVSFDSSGKPWLIQISSDQKVWAMPLPIIPITASIKFHNYVEEELGDDELLEVLNTFGALPSGEGFPESAEDFQRWVRAGVIIEICDTLDFHFHIPMYSACGWSFNNFGNMAYNTAYFYDQTTGLIFCNTFKLSLALGNSPYYYGATSVQIGGDLTNDERNKVADYIAAIFKQLKTDSVLGRTIQFKFRLVGTQVISERANSVSSLNVASEIEYWDNYVCDPIANHSGNVNKVYGGYLFHPAKPKFQPQIKFPDYQAGGLISFDFSPAETGWVVACDTIMFAYFDNDSLQVIKYFYDGRTYSKEVDTDFEECMSVGSWYMNTTEGVTSLVGNFYTTEIDERDEMSQTTIKTTVVGRDLGYNITPFFEFDAFFWRPGSLWRYRYFSRLTKTTRVSGSSMQLGVCVPMFQRAATLYAIKNYSGATSYSESMAKGAVGDPYTYRYWTHDHIWAWRGGLEVMKGRPYPKDGNPVWVEMENYNPSVCSDFADNGPWIPSLPADYTWLIHPNRMEWRHRGGGEEPPLNTYSISNDKPGEYTGKIMMTFNGVTKQITKTVPDEWYFKMSPDDFGGVMYRDACRVFLGTTEYGNISEYDAGHRVRVGNSRIADHGRAQHFIGVINE